MKVVWSLLAQRRLLEIEEYIAEDSPVAAERFVDELVSKGEALAKSPMRGRLVPEFPGSELREIIEGNYRIFYRVQGKTIAIVSVMEGHRLLTPNEVGE